MRRIGMCESKHDYDDYTKKGHVYRYCKGERNTVYVNGIRLGLHEFQINFKIVQNEDETPKKTDFNDASHLWSKHHKLTGSDPDT